jgi:hypothetical protein
LKASEISDWLGVVTNLGVVAGLALVAYEIHQNNIALDREARLAQVEVTDGLRAQWQNWEYAIVENRELSDIWMRGNSGESLDPLEEYRYGQLAKEMYRLTGQNYRQYSLVDGEPADWAVYQLAQAAKGNARLKAVFLEQLNRPGSQRDTEYPDLQDFVSRIKLLDPPELRPSGN